MRRRRSSSRELCLLIRIIITMIGKAFLGGGEEKASEGEDEGAQRWKRPRRRPRLLLLTMLRTMATTTRLN
jgi:hypothetical protein